MFHLSQIGPDGVDVTVGKGEASHAAAIDVAGVEVRGAGGVEDRLGTDDRTTRDIDGDVAVVVAVNHLTVARVVGSGEEGTHRSQTAATVDVAEHSAARDVNLDIAAYGTCRECFATEATTCAEDVTVDI